MGALEGKVAVITGGNSGIGLASAKLFAINGAHVVITGRRDAAVESALSIIGHDAIGFTGDVSRIEHHETVASEVARRFGRIDIYMANAGANTINPHSFVTEQEFDLQFSTNAKGTYFGVQKMAPLLRDHGSIILTGSIAAERYMDGHSVYAGSKAAVNAFARAWAIELRARAIRVNVLSPGPVDTPILSKLGVAEHEQPAFKRAVAESIPLGHLGTPDELARAALFLASDESSFITGINLRVDGGMAVL